MPQAETWLRKKMLDRFPTERGVVDIGPPLEFLMDRGFREGANGLLRVPTKYKYLSQIPEDEWDCILYLVHEWDFDVDPTTYQKEPSDEESRRDDNSPSGASNAEGHSEGSSLDSPASGVPGGTRE